MTWVYHQLFHDPQPDGSGTDALLTRLVAPAVADLTGCGVIDRFFFLRYAEDGHHVRLRLRVSHGADPTAVASRLDALAGECPLVTRVVHAQYEPELQKHGGPIGQEIAERQFHSSSRLALGCIGRTISHPRCRWIVAAWALERTLGCAGIEGRERRWFLQAYADHWRTIARKIGVDRPASMPDEQATGTVRALSDDQVCVNALVEDASGFVTCLERDIDELVAADRSALLSAPLTAVIANLLHTSHNRLGLSIIEEAWLAGLLAAADPARPVRRAPASGVQPHVAVSRLVERTLRRSTEIALVEGSDPAVLNALIEAGAAAGLRTIHAIPGDIAEPFAPLQALADAHPAGARLRLALRRIERAHDDQYCSLPPDASAVGHALRTFLVRETSVPTLLLLALGAADADTLHSVLFLARSIEDLPLALVLLADNPPRASWQSFVRALADGPGFFRINTDAGMPERVPDKAVPRSSIERATRFVRAGAVSEGASLLSEALAREPLAPAARAEALIVLAQATLRASRPALARQALDAAAVVGIPSERAAFARRLRLAALHSLGDSAGLEALHQGVAADAARAGSSPIEQSWALLDAALVSATPDRQAEHEAYLDALLAHPGAEDQCLLAAHAWRAAAHVGRAEFDRAFSHQRQAVAYAERVGDFSRALFLRARLAASAAAEGRLDEAEELFGVTAEAAAWAGVRDLAALAAQHTITLALMRGDHGVAAKWLLEPQPIRRAAWQCSYGRLASLYVHAKVLFAAGQLQAARSFNQQLRSHLAALQDARPENADLLEIMMERLDMDVALASGDTVAHDAAGQRAAELELRLQPFERRLAAALSGAQVHIAGRHTETKHG